MSVTLYSTHCPRCNVLEKKLQQAGIEFNMITDPAEVLKIGKANMIMTAPILDVDGQVMDFSKANEWINNEKR